MYQGGLLALCHAFMGNIRVEWSRHFITLIIHSSALHTNKDIQHGIVYAEHAISYKLEVQSQFGTQMHMDYDQ